MSRTILTMEIRSEQDVVLTRQRVRQIAELLGYDSQDQTRFATAISEIARNAFKYAAGGKVEFLICDQSAQQAFLVRIQDKGQGIRDLDSIMNGRYLSKTGMGLGIMGSKKLMDHFEIETIHGIGKATGTTVILGKDLPVRKVPLGNSDIGLIAAELARRFPQTPFEELQQQNQELMRTLERVTQLNQELEDTNRGVVALYAELDEKADHLQRANEVKTRFLSNMTHEFRTPLNSILSLSKLLLDQVDGSLNAEQTKQVSFIERSAADLSELVNDLLDLAKVAAGKVTVRPSEFKVDELFGALRGMLKPLLASNTSVNLVFEEPVGIATIFSDEAKISQILRNFISNALKFTERGEVRVSARMTQDNTIVFAVADTGIGIAGEDQGRIFEEFSQVDSHLQRKSRGTGLGLPLTRQLAGLLGGSVECKSELGVGSTFYAILPCTYRDSNEGLSISEISRKLDGTSLPVLVLEDNRESLFIYEKMLKGSGFQVIPARTVREARELIKQVRPVAVISDILLETESAWGFLSELKRQPETADIPLLIITMVDNERKARAIGASAFHLKPVDGEWLIARLIELVPYQSQKKILIVDDDDIARYILKTLLLGFGHPIIEASDALSGLELAKRESPSLVFMDLNMPGMDGTEALKLLKAAPQTSAIPVIVNTSKTLSEQERSLLSELAVEVLSKESRGDRQQRIQEMGAVLQRAGSFDTKRGSQS